jgi:hypothetical protein
MKLSQKIKDIFDIIRALSSYLSILIIAFGLYFTYSIGSLDISKIPSHLLTFGKIIAIILIFSPFILYFYDWLKLKYIIYRGNLSGYIIEKHEVVIDIYHKKGKYADVHQKIFFHKFSNKSKEQFISKLEVSGKIIAKTIQCLNCFHTLNREQNNLKISYVNSMGKLNKTSNFFKENDKFLISYMTLKDSFVNEEESWDMDIKNLCQDYTLEIIMPKNKKVKYANFIRVNSPDEIIKDIQPIVVKYNDRFKIVLRVMNFDKNESFKLIWALA